MKTIKSILIAATLICATAVSAQEAQAPKHEFKVAIGDSVMIKRECQKYCTGETPSVWVWDKVHTVRQLGTKRFPDGVLLMNIYSWMCEDCLIPVNGNAADAADKASKEQADAKKAYEQAVKEGKDPHAAAAEAAKAAEEAKPAEPAAPAEEAKPAEEAAPAEEAKPAEPIAAEEVIHEAAKGDSIHSEQHFKHNYDRFTIGVRGGASSLLHHTQKDFSLTNGPQWTCGFDAVLDLQYAHYWAKDGRPVDLGLIVGLGLGYAQSALKTSQWDYLPNYKASNLDYLILANNIRENDRQLQLEVPIMFSLIHDCGVFFNFGPKFMIPVYTMFDQKLKQADVNVFAYDPALGVTFDNNVVTGKYDESLNPTGDNGMQFKFNIMLTAEIGYEWTLKSGNSLGLGAYADYSVFNSYKNAATSGQSLIDLVTAPSASGVAQLGVLSATKTYADKIGFFDVGIKLAYHFNFPKKLKEVKAE
jgi:hypothetical protein